MPEAPRRPRVPADLAARIDVARGDVPFERWVRRALEQALGDSPPGRVMEVGPEGGGADSRRVAPSPAPARASGRVSGRKLTAEDFPSPEVLAATREPEATPFVEMAKRFKAPCCDFTAPSPNAVCRAHGRKVRSV